MPEIRPVTEAPDERKAAQEAVLMPTGTVLLIGVPQGSIFVRKSPLTRNQRAFGFADHLEMCTNFLRLVSLQQILHPAVSRKLIL